MILHTLVPGFSRRCTHSVVAGKDAHSVSTGIVSKRESRQSLELHFGISDERLRQELMEVAQLLKTSDREQSRVRFKNESESHQVAPI